jgi:hypothetical protein
MRTLLGILVPLVLLELVLVVVALVDLARREPERVNGPKWLWAVIILFANLVGPVLYFIVGRRS